MSGKVPKPIVFHRGGSAKKCLTCQYEAGRAAAWLSASLVATREAGEVRPRVTEVYAAMCEHWPGLDRAVSHVNTLRNHLRHCCAEWNLWQDET